MNKETWIVMTDLLKKEDIWDSMMNTVIYTPSGLIEYIGKNKISLELQVLLKENVSKIQKYFDDRIIEPL
jgi:hypothetical protein